MIVYETQRLIVRDWTESPADLARVYGIYSRTEVVRWLGAAPGLPLTDPAQAVDLVRRRHARHAAYAGRYGIWAIEVRDTGVAVGTVLLKPMPGRVEGELTTDIEVGWHLHPDSWGHGYATEAAREAVARELATDTPRVFAVISPGNEPSQAVARRLGMRHLGRRTDWYGGEELETFVLPAGA